MEALLVSLLAVLVTVEGGALKYRPLFGTKDTAPVESTDGQGKWKPPSFCNGLECPQYKVVKKTASYEVRQYARSQWVTTSLTGVDFEAAQSTMFMRLFRYIGGANAEKKKIAMTAPVRTKIIPGQGPACANDFTMSFFVAPEEGMAVPQPTDKTVSVTALEPLTVYVRSFPGYAREVKTWLTQATKLADAIAKDGGSFVKDHYYIDGYDSPFKFLNRHNEIWFIKT